MKKTYWLSYFVWGGLLAMWLYGSSAVPTAAHAGGTPLIINEPAGTFLVSLWSLPNSLVANQEANLIVALASPSPELNTRAGLVVLNADIDITLTTADGRETVTVQPTHAQATNKLFYEGYFVFPLEGEWQGEIRVSKDGESGTATFSVLVEPDGGREINWFLIGGTAVLLIGLGWFLWQSRNPVGAE